MIAKIFGGARALTLLLGLSLAAIGPAIAQETDDRVWIQIESYPALTPAEERVRAYAQILEDVNGFQRGDFYAVALGPYTRAEADRLLRELRGNGTIPGDSFLQDASAFSAPFFPVGVDTLSSPAVDTAAAALDADTPAEPQLSPEEIAAAEAEAAARAAAAIQEAADAERAAIAARAEAELAAAATAETAAEAQALADEADALARAAEAEAAEARVAADAATAAATAADEAAAAAMTAEADATTALAEAEAARADAQSALTDAEATADAATAAVDAASAALVEATAAADLATTGAEAALDTAAEALTAAEAAEAEAAGIEEDADALASAQAAATAAREAANAAETAAVEAAAEATSTQIALEAARTALTDAEAAAAEAAATLDAATEADAATANALTAAETALADAILARETAETDAADAQAAQAAAATLAETLATTAADLRAEADTLLAASADASTAAAEAAEALEASLAAARDALAEARASEGQLSRPERDALQIALQFFGFYDSGIDGAFGPGTRRGMTAWQESRGFEPTGVLTAAQRAYLLQEQARELGRIGFAEVRDESAGIVADLPLGMVAFSEYNFPFAQYESINDSGLRVLLISQPGDRATLFGLYEIMQTLEIVPTEGQRERRGDSFLLTGQNDRLRSHTEARIVGGAVKGFTLVWEPARDEDIASILPRLQDTISYFTGALDPAYVPEDAGEDIDLVSGLEVRRPERMRSGFYVDAAGTVLTSIEAVTSEAGSCERVLIDNAYPSDVTYTNEALGLAVLTPQQPLAPVDFARLAEGPAQPRGEIAVSGFPFDGALTSASTSFGTVEALAGVNGETTLQRLAVRTAASEAGGPVFDMAGSVVGMVLPGIFDGRALPDEVTLALRLDQLGDVLAEAGVNVSPTAPAGLMNRETLSRMGSDIAVRVSCWN